MGSDIRHRRGRTAGGPRDADLVRAAILARLHRRGWTLDDIARVLGVGKSTVHRRLKELTPTALAELQSADLGGML